MIFAMVLEFPDDAETWGTDTAYQFMSGEWFLVAPMVIDSDVRYQTYFPEGDWIDYWDGSVITGPTWLDSYDAPLEKLPLFVKAGAIVPMQPEMLHHRQKTADPLTLDIYPAGSTRFELYEDDAVTRAHENGAYSTQDITSDAPQGEAGVVTITVGL